MYNGIGLPTARGSGTNGYVQKNLSNLKYNYDRSDTNRKNVTSPLPSQRKVDKGIIEHEERRKIEIECCKLRYDLENENVSEDIIESKVIKLRKELLENFKSTTSKKE